MTSPGWVFDVLESTSQRAFLDLAITTLPVELSGGQNSELGASLAAQLQV
jgi:hypothetical protein